MSRAGIVAAATVAVACIACASHRERRQSAFGAERHTVDVQYDSMGYNRAFVGKMVELVEVEALIGSTDRFGRSYFRCSRCTVPTGGLTFGNKRLTDRCNWRNNPLVAKTGSPRNSYIRVRRLTVSTDSGTVSRGSVSNKDSLTSEQVRSRSTSTEKHTPTTVPWWVWGLVCLLVMLSVYRLVRKVNR